jgi:hypothetical protein
VAVGKDKTEFLIYTRLLSYHSGFFQAATSDRWGCGREKNVQLEEEDPRIFSIFLTWMLTGNITNSGELVRIDSLYPGDDSAKLAKWLESLWDQLVRCWIMSTFLQAPRFGNHLVDILLLATKKYFECTGRVLGMSATSLKLIYGSTVASSPLRRILIDNYTAALCTKQEEPWAKSSPEIMLYFCQKFKSAWQEDAGKYHENPKSLSYLASSNTVDREIPFSDSWIEKFR